MASQMGLAKVTTGVLVVFALLSQPSHAKSTEAGESKVVVLTDENFDTLTQSGEWIVKIYAPW
eukprot:scaffold668727_cov67-Prasinocladus_malaysianus.AAC.1